MKAVVLAALSSLGLYGQWITGYYSSGDAVESVSAIPWSKCTQHCAVPNRLRNHMPQARLVIPSTRSVGIEDADNPAACAAATDFLPRPDIFQSQPSRRFRGNPNDHLEVNQHPRAACAGQTPGLLSTSILHNLMRFILTNISFLQRDLSEFRAAICRSPPSAQSNGADPSRSTARVLGAGGGGPRVSHGNCYNARFS
jgi:hypothetical protein